MRAKRELCGLLLAGSLLGLTATLSFVGCGPISDFPSSATGGPGGLGGGWSDAGSGGLVDGGSDDPEGGIDVDGSCVPVDGAIGDGATDDAGALGTTSQPLVPPFERPFIPPDAGAPDAGSSDAGLDAGDAGVVPGCPP